jgi:hypothetical protein
VQQGNGRLRSGGKIAAGVPCLLEAENQPLEAEIPREAQAKLKNCASRVTRGAARCQTVGAVCRARAA